MQDPVVAADGHTYERTAIQAWMDRRGEQWPSPMTNQMIEGNALIPNHNLRSAIRQYEAEVQQAQRAEQAFL